MPILTIQLIYVGIMLIKEQVNIVASEGVLMAGVNLEVFKATRIGKNLRNA